MQGDVNLSAYYFKVHVVLNELEAISVEISLRCSNVCPRCIQYLKYNLCVYKYEAACRYSGQVTYVYMLCIILCIRSMYTEFVIRYNVPDTGTVSGTFFLCGIRNIVLDIGKYELLVSGTLYLIISGIMFLIPKIFSWQLY